MNMKDDAQTDPGAEAQPRTRRQYLPAEQRKKELLDAALIEFSTMGYGHATVERIATRAGLSKAGVYAHYRSKEEMLEDLLISLLSPGGSIENWSIDIDMPMEAAIRTFVDQLYAPLENPKFLAMQRVLIAESTRAHVIIARWREQVLRPYVERQQRVIDECRAKGLVREGPMSQHFVLGFAPVVLATHILLIAGDTEQARADVAAIRASHLDYLMDGLLRAE
ncbi:helix-turn-helix domain-containing protein [Diaphorobacter sp.]|uniref:TetR/AcrR family transcriptional regulator n=1 Tax=Diaphorobacter sp. TaxID=1934310 RepID=UPI0028AB7FCE|nr:helix-turn-helix domain-containing protein [Diaphorobacter sp.]